MRDTGGMNPSPTVGGRFAANVVGGGVPDAPRRGQDPSLRCKPLKGMQRQGCGPGMPGPYGVAWMSCAREGQGRAAARPFQVGGWLPVNGWRRKARQSPSGLASSASSPLRGAPFCAGEAREKSLPCQREVPSASEAEGFLAVRGCNEQSGKARRNPPGR